MKFNFCFLLSLLAFFIVLAHARGGSIVLNWTSSVSSGVAGYNVYFGTTAGNYPYKLNVGNADTITISNLAEGATYYFAATAYDSHGNESSLSAPTSITVPDSTTSSSQSSPAGGSPAAVNLVGLALTLTPGNREGASLRFPVRAGHSYEVQATSDLRTWISLWRSSTAAGVGQMQYTDNLSRNFNSRFYRVILH